MFSKNIERKTATKSLETDEEYELVRTPLKRASALFLQDSKVETKVPAPRVFAPGLTLTLDVGSPPAAGRGRKQISSLPEPIKLFPGIKRRIQYGATGAVSAQQISVGTLIAALGMIASTVANAYTVCSTIRLKKIRIWPSPSSSGASNSAFVSWLGSSANIPDDTAVQATVNNVLQAGCLEFVPPDKSLASFNWSSVDASTILLEMSCPQGSVVEVESEGHQSVAIPNVLVTSAGSHFVAGSMYYGHLDATTVHLTPFGLLVVSDV